MKYRILVSDNNRIPQIKKSFFHKWVEPDMLETRIFFIPALYNNKVKEVQGKLPFNSLKSFLPSLIHFPQ